MDIDAVVLEENGVASEEDFTVDAIEDYDNTAADKERRRKKISRARGQARKKNSGKKAASLAGIRLDNLSHKEKIKTAEAIVSDRKEFLGRKTDKKRVRRDAIKREIKDSEDSEIIEEQSTVHDNGALVSECKAVTEMLVELHSRVENLGYETSAKLIKRLISRYCTEFDVM